MRARTSLRSSPREAPSTSSSSPAGEQPADEAALAIAADGAAFGDWLRGGGPAARSHMSRIAFSKMIAQQATEADGEQPSITPLTTGSACMNMP